MKRTILTFIGFFFLLSASAQSPSLKEFSFLLGSWEVKSKEGKITEHWKEGSKQYIGASYKHNSRGDSTLTETVIIQQLHGTWFYCVTGHEKNNQGTTNFRLISTKKNRLLFENREHDFPQQIGYQLKEKDNLFAWIAGKNNGKEMKIDFDYERKKKSSK